MTKSQEAAKVKNHQNTADAAPHSWRDAVLLPLQQAKLISGVSTATLYRAQENGELDFRSLGGRTLVTTESLIKYIESATPWVASDRGEAGRASRRVRAAEAWAE
jgi:hypothetical protein